MEKQEDLTGDPNKSNAKNEHYQDNLASDPVENEIDNDHRDTSYCCGLNHIFDIGNEQDDNEDDDSFPIDLDGHDRVHAPLLENPKITIDRTTLLGAMLENVENAVKEHTRENIDSQDATWYQDMMANKVIDKAISDQRILGMLM